MFETARCSIKRFSRNDQSDVEALYVNEQVRQFLGGPRQVDLTKERDEMLASPAHSNHWVVREKQTNDFIGLVTLDPHHNGVDLELSYQLLPEWWGNGYATEVLKTIIHYAFNNLNLPKVMAETQIANKASCALLEKVGMRFEQTINRFGAEQAIYSIRST
ncbi:GNAT family N-acetyltransferase [Bacillus sp. JCM 19041]|uniref:GNAT family N-acetyltransferase n=1 Tax=Bacillus sp. JCM 19041 TaxID=1460637 RepID=UPI0006D0582B